MKIFIDESGGFSWGREPDVSLFCGVTVSDRNQGPLFDRFVSWRRSIIGDGKREIKGSELTEDQRLSFAKDVLPFTDQDTWLTVVGIDTSVTLQEHVERLREQASVMAFRSSEIAAEHGNLALQEIYRQMAGWLKSRSPENILWIVGIEETILNSLQHSIIRFMEPEDDAEFVDLQIIIDESFVKRDQHLDFWRDWLRNGFSKSSRTEHIIMPKTWRPRNHPFIAAYSVHPGVLDLRPLIVEQTGFFNSKKTIGLQIADICANTLYRYHRGNGAVDAYRQLRPRIVGRDGVEIYEIHINEESLHSDDPRNHVGIFDLNEYKAKADRARAVG